MRATLPLTLGVSLAVHAVIVGGIVLSGSHASFVESTPRAEQPTTLTLVRPTFAPVRPASAPEPAHTSAAKSAPVAMSTPLASPHPTAKPAPAMENGPAMLARTVTEKNSITPTPIVPPENALSPASAPKLDGTKGVVYLLDVSGSMYEPFDGAMRLTYARQSLSRRINALPDGTPFAVVLYAEHALISGPLVAASPAARDAAVSFIMRDADCGGGTNLPAGLAAARGFNTGAIVLATDGDLHISISSLMLQSREILGEPGRAPSLEVIGIAPRPHTIDDHLLQDLADEQSGTYTVECTDDETAMNTPQRPETER